MLTKNNCNIFRFPEDSPKIFSKPKGCCSHPTVLSEISKIKKEKELKPLSYHLTDKYPTQVPCAIKLKNGLHRH